jgi:hypothetical protein
MLVPFNEALGNDFVAGLEHLSYIGLASFIRVPSEMNHTLFPPKVTFKCDGIAPFVCPEMRLMAPGVEDPNVDAKKLSFIEKCCA